MKYLDNLTDMEDLFFQFKLINNEDIDLFLRQLTCINLKIQKDY